MSKTQILRGPCESVVDTQIINLHKNLTNGCFKNTTTDKLINGEIGDDNDKIIPDNNTGGHKHKKNIFIDNNFKYIDTDNDDESAADDVINVNGRQYDDNANDQKDKNVIKHKTMDFRNQHRSYSKDTNILSTPLHGRASPTIAKKTTVLKCNNDIKPIIADSTTPSLPLLTANMCNGKYSNQDDLHQQRNVVYSIQNTINNCMNTTKTQNKINNNNDNNNNNNNQNQNQTTTKISGKLNGCNKDDDHVVNEQKYNNGNGRHIIYNSNNVRNNNEIQQRIHSNDKVYVNNNNIDNNNLNTNNKNNKCDVKQQMAKNEQSDVDLIKINTNSNKNNNNNNCNNINKKNINDKLIVENNILKTKNKINSASANRKNIVNGGAILENNVLLNGVENEDEDDPYIQLEEYLDKVNREINEVFEQFRLSDKLPTVSLVPDRNNNKLLPEQKCKKSKDIIADDKITIENMNQKQQQQQQQQQQQEAEVKRTTEWANTILQELDNLMKADKHCTDKRNDRDGDRDGDGGKQLATTPIKSIDTTTLTNNKIIQNNNNNNILKPEKHIYIPLQSFSLKDSLLETSSQKDRSKKLTIDEKRNQQQQPLQKLSKSQNEKLSALRIEEDRCLQGQRDLPGTFNHHKLIESKDIFTQTDPINYVHRKGSTSTIWTSDESILRSTDNVDEDNKSSSSSDEPSALLLSSSKSGNSLDSSELDNDNTESGIGSTASPPKDKESYRWNTMRKQTQPFLLNSNKQTWVRRESVQTQTNPVTIQPIIKMPKNFSMDSNANEPDLLEVLSLFEVEGTEDFECIEDELTVNSSKPPPITRIRTIQDTYYNNNNDDINNNINNIHNNNNNNNNGDDVQLRNKSLKYSTLLSKQSDIKSNASSRNVSSYPVNYQSDNAAQVINNRSVYDSLPLVRREAYGSYDKKYTNDILASQQKRPFCLPIGNPDAYLNNMMELPSPSSASLHSGLGNIGMQELTTKSSSAPILLKKEKRKDDFGFGPPQMNLRYSRSQSDRYLAEIEAIEACKWLRAAGFPQYAQMYEDLQFPIDLSNVAKDHPFLENDPLQSLYRRLVALNKSASMRLDSAYKHGNKEDSEDDEYALSENWTFQKNIRRWSRVDEMGMDSLPTVPVSSASRKAETILSRDSSPDHTDSDNIGFSTLPIGATFANNGNSTDSGVNDQLPVRFRRTGSERLKDGAKAILRRVESIKSRRRKRQNREGVIISGPQVLDLPHMNQKINDLKCVDIVTMSTPPSPVSHNSFLLSPNYSINTNINNNNNNNNNNITVNDSKLISGRLSPNRLSPVHHQHPHHYGTLQQSHSANHSTTQLFHHNRTSPLHFFSHPTNSLQRDFKSGDETSSYCSDGSQDSSAGGVGITGSGGGGGGGVGGVNSGSPFLEVTSGNGANIIKKRPSRTRRFLQGGSKVEDIGALSDSECHHARRKQRYFKDSITTNTNTNGNGGVKVTKIARGGSLNLGKESQRYRDTFRSRSFRSKSSTAYRKDKGSESDRDDDVLIRSSRPTVVRWHSFRSSHERPDTVFKKCFATRTQDFTEGTPFEALSAGQLQVVRKLALVTLTGYMERYCPTHRTGWNWELPKFIKKIKTPDYKDKKIFGVPLLLTLQRTGQTLPKSIQNALKWLKLNALDQVGLFRKPGVKSRIHNLKTIIEQGNVIDEIAVYDQQQAFDVADMVKQYFRELPDTLLTAKLSETFIAIFLHLPAEVRQDALQSAVLLLPDEHREVLQYILEFLNNVADNAAFNQMTANNLAVCFAPSLFHGGLTNIRQNAVSPRRRKPIGIPDSRELAETRASHDCLTYLIQHYRTIFSISIEKMSHCNFGYMEESRPVPLEALGEGLQVHDWRGYLYECTSATIKEGREKSRSWISTSSFDSNVDIAYKKVGDGHPLRLWKCTTEVEAPPLEVLQYIFKERHLWDSYLLKWRIIEQLDERSEIFQYANGGQTISDYCVLRSWRSDLPRGACVIVETSVDHADATLLLGGVRGVVLASRYLIEPCGSGRSRIMHLARVDTKGRTPEWYNKSYGHICSHYLTKIRNSFKHVTTGPESKV